MIANLEYQLIFIVSYDPHRLPTLAGLRHIETGICVWETDSQSSWHNQCTILGGAVIAIHLAYLWPGHGIVRTQLLEPTDSGVVIS